MQKKKSIFSPGSTGNTVKDMIRRICSQICLHSVKTEARSAEGRSAEGVCDREPAGGRGFWMGSPIR